MQTVRRLYLYFIAAVSLTMLAVGLVNLLDLAFTQAWIALGGPRPLGEDAEWLRRQVSLFTALVVPALPIWLLHWWLIERSVARDADDSERRSAVRALYLALALAASLVAGTLATGQVIASSLRLLLAGTQREGEDLPAALATALIAGAIWGYHARVRLRDRQGGPLDGAAAWLGRLYLYGAVVLGAARLLFGATDLLRLLSDLLLGGARVGSGVTWWATPLTNGVAQVAVGLLVWAGHWSYAWRLLQRQDWQGQGERASLVRRVAYYGLILLCVLMTLAGLSASLEALLRWLLGAARASAPFEILRSIVEPPLGVLPFALFWLLHRRWLMAESAASVEGPQQAAVRRFYTYGVALAGLLFAAIGLSNVIAVLLDLLLDGGRGALQVSPTWGREQVSQFVALALVGSSVWLWHWAMVAGWVARDPASERPATSRRLYLFAILAGALVALLVSLTVIINRLLNLLLGGLSSGLVADLSTPIGVALVALPLLVYHALILRTDLALRPLPVLTAPEHTLPLLLSGPPEADLAALLTELRAHLPPGYSLHAADGQEPAGVRVERPPDPAGAPSSV